MSKKKSDTGAANLSVILLVLALVCFVVFTMIGAEWITSDKGAVWLGGGLALFTAAHLPT